MPDWTIPPDQRAGQDENPGALDYLKTAGSSAAGLLAIPLSAAQYAAESANNPTVAQGAAGGSELLHGAADYLTSTLSPAAQDTEQHPEDHRVSSVGMGAAGLAPVLGAFAGLSLAAPGVVPEAVAGGALQGGQLVDHVISTTNAMSDDQLAQASPTFKADVDNGMDPAQARIKLHHDMITTPDLAMSLITGIAAGGIGGRLLRGAGASAFGKGLVARTLTGGAEGAAAGAAMTGEGEYAQQDADVVAGMRPDVDYAGITSDALSSGLAFGALGGIGGAVGGDRSAGRDSTVRADAVTEAGPDPSQTAALTSDRPVPIDDGTAQTSGQAPAVPAAPAPQLDAVAGGEREAAATPPPPVPAPPEPAPPPPAAATERASPPVGATQRPVPPEAVVPPVADNGSLTPPTPTDPQGTVAEGPATFAAQQRQLVNGEGGRKAVLFPPGTNALPLPDGMSYVRTKAGIVQFDPTKTNKAEIIKAVARNTLGKFLGLGDVTKDEAVSRIAAGETPASTVERTPDGTEVRAAVGTMQTALEQQKAMEATKSPENTVAQENPDVTLAKREADTKGTALDLTQDTHNTPHDIAADAVATPTPEQAASGDYSKGHAKWEGLDTTIETPKGGTRTAEDGSWQVNDFPAHYGSIDKTKGADGDEVDMFMGDHPKSKRVFLIDQKDPETQKFDEHKAMLGFDTLAEAHDAYHKAFSDGSGPSRRGATSTMSVDEFKDWLKNGDTTKPKRYAEPVAKDAGRRVLADKTPQPKAEAVKKADTREGAHENKDVIAKRAESAKQAGEIMQKHVPDHYIDATTIAARKALGDRIEAMLDEMAKSGIKINSKVGYENRPNEFVYAADAKAMLKQLRQHDLVKPESAKGKEFAEKVQQFLMDEQFAKRGDYAPLRSRRAEVGKDIETAKKKGASVDVSDENVSAARDTAGAPTGDVAFSRPQEERIIASEDAREEEPEFKSPEEAYQAGAERAPVKIADDAVTGHKDRAGQFKVETSKKRVIKRPNVSGRGDANAQHVGNGGFAPEEIHSAKPLSQMRVDHGANKGTMRILNERVWKRLQDLAGDVPVLVVDNAAMQRQWKLEENTQTVDGWYDPEHGHIVISSDFVKDGKVSAPLMIHEALHAAFERQIEDNPELQKLLGNMLDHVKDEHGGLLKMLSQDYGLSNIHEFISEGLSNPDFQDILAQVEAPDSVKKALGLGGQPTTMWDALAHAVRKFVLGMSRMFGSGSHDLTVLEALLRVGKHLDDAATFEKVLGGKDVNPGSNEYSLARVSRRAVTDPGAAAEDGFAAPMKAVQKNVLQAVKDGWKSSANRRRMMFKFLTLDQMRQSYEHLFPEGTMRTMGELLNKGYAYANDLMKPGWSLVREATRLQRSDPKNWANLVDLSDDARIYSAHPDKALGHADNTHLADPEYAQGAAKHADLAARFAALPEPMKALWPKLVKFYADSQGDHASRLLDSEFRGHENMADVDAIKKRILDGKTTDVDHAALAEEFGSDERADDIIGERAYRRAVGPYFPLSRRGDFVVSAMHKVAAPEGGTALAKGQHGYEFSDKAKRDEFVKNLVPVSTSQEIHYDPDSGKRLSATTDINDKTKFPNGVDTRYQVKYDPKHVEFHEKQTDARNVAAALKQDPNFEQVHGEREKDEYAQGELTSPAISNLVKRLGAGKSEAYKANLRKELEDSAIAMQPGSRIMKHQLTARKLSGSSVDLVRTLGDYNVASARARARLEYEAEMDKTLGNMKSFEKTREDDKTLLRSGVLHEIEGRRNNTFEANPGNGFTGFMNSMMSLSFMKHMMSPAHLLLHMTHPGMISLPVLGARHGYGKAAVALARAYKDMGPLGALKEGFKGAARMGKDITADPTNFIDYFKGKTAKAADAGRISRMLDSLSENGYIHPDAGMELHRMDPGRNVVTQGIDRVDGAFRELTNATESINRVAEAITAYRLEFDKTGSHDAAVRYAGDTLANTQGLYTRSNAAPIFQNKYARPFLQFKQYPQMIYHLLGRQLVDTFKGESKEVRMQAAKGFAGVIATHALMAGALGLPLELFKIPVMAAHALGLTDMTWEKLEEGFQEGVASKLGPQWGEILSHGLSRALGPFSVDVHHRLGLNSLLSFGEPDSSKPQDTIHYMLDFLGGAPASTAEDMIKGIQAGVGGDFQGMAENVIPAKAITDVVKAIQLATQGKPTSKGRAGMAPTGLGPAFVQAMGFKPGSVSQYDEARNASYNHYEDEKKSKTDLVSAWVKAAPADKGAAMKAITAFNKTLDPKDQITHSSLTASLKASKAPTVLGVPVNKHNQKNLQTLQQEYNAP